MVGGELLIGSHDRQQQIDTAIRRVDQYQALLCRRDLAAARGARHANRRKKKNEEMG